jgi:threonine dehydrogenase-like Zn-dependent dehydrogenase
MRATFMYGPGDVRVENVPDPKIVEPTDAIVRITLACVCGSDLHPYHSMDKTDEGAPMGHEFLGIVEETGSEVRGLRRGDFVVSPFAFADNTCPICRDGFHTACPHGGWYGAGGVGGAQAEAVRVPQADGTLVKIPTNVDAALLPSLLALSDVYLTGYQRVKKVTPNRTKPALKTTRKTASPRPTLVTSPAARTESGSPGW